jgi:hypothetical protein
MVVCPRCQRANPQEAVYCHFDGSALHTALGPAWSATAPLPREFIFPSGRRCRTLDDLVQGCQYEWEDARDLLQNGGLSQFFAGIGRLDLARAADEADRQPDADVALHDFVAALPAAQVQGPRLELNPRRMALGGVRVGETQALRLMVSNGGKGLLQGKLAVNDGERWLTLDDGSSQCALKTGREQPISLRLDTHGLTAPRSYAATLRVITNGGIAEVPVGVDVTAVPFPRPPFQGVAAPREIAEQMRAQPKAAVPLLESGDLARWFDQNGWAFPIVGQPAKGVAAVQQFFEGMGLSKPPPLHLSSIETRLSCPTTEVARGHVTLGTTVRKWVYAQVASAEPWLRVTTPTVSGPQQAVIAFEADPTRLPAGRRHTGTLRIVANAGQQLAVKVLVDVERPASSAAQRMARPIAAAAVLFMVYRLLLAIPADLYARAWADPAPVTFATWLQPPRLEGGFVRHFALATWWLGALAGGMTLWRRGGRWLDTVFGVVAGGVAGVLATATLACVLPTLDAPVRVVWEWAAALIPEALFSAGALWSVVWVVCAAGWWAAVGSMIGLLAKRTGPSGLALLQALRWPFLWIGELAGLEGLRMVLASPSTRPGIRETQARTP